MKLQNLKRQLQLQEWASQINAQRQNGMAAREWCEAAGIDYNNVTISDDIICISEFDDIDFQELPFW